MALETASTIADLVSTNPVGASDTPASLDDHIRLIKTVLKADAMGASTVHAATTKATPVDADSIGLVDTAASNVLKKLTWANAKATLKTYFDTLYQTSDAELTALAGLTSAANKVPMFSGSGTATLIDFKDEDNMSSNSATAVPSQQSVKAYVDGLSTVNSDLSNLSATGKKRVASAWVQFDSAGNIAGSGAGQYNVTSVTKNGTGDFTINFTSSLPNTYYAVSGAFNNGAAANMSLHTLATGSCRVQFYSSAATLFDPLLMTVMVFGGV